MKKILIGLFLFASFSSIALSSELDCAAFCLGEVIDENNVVSDTGWIQITGSGNDLEEVFVSFEKNCKEKIIKQARILSIELDKEYTFYKTGTIFTKYHKNHIFMPKDSCLGNTN